MANAEARAEAVSAGMVAAFDCGTACSLPEHAVAKTPSATEIAGNGNFSNMNIEDTLSTLEAGRCRNNLVDVSNRALSAWSTFDAPGSNLPNNCQTLSRADSFEDEYFAESVRAYVEINDPRCAWLPVTRQDLFLRDPRMFALVDRLFASDFAACERRSIERQQCFPAPSERSTGACSTKPSRQTE